MDEYGTSYKWFLIPTFIVQGNELVLNIPTAAMWLWMKVKLNVIISLKIIPKISRFSCSYYWLSIFDNIQFELTCILGHKDQQAWYHVTI